MSCLIAIIKSVNWRIIHMSTNKINRVLLLFHKLIKGEQIHKADFARTHDVSERSIERDIEDIRIFLSEIHSNDKLIFDKLENVYYLLTTGNNDKLNNIWNKSCIKILSMSKDKGFLG